MIMTSVCTTMDNSNKFNSVMTYASQARANGNMLNIEGNHDTVDDSDHESQSTFGPSCKFVNNPVMSINACSGPLPIVANRVNSTIFHITTNVHADEADQESDSSFGEDSANTFDINAYCSSDDDQGSQKDSYTKGVDTMNASITNSRPSFALQHYFQQQRHESCLDTTTILSCDEPKLNLNQFPGRGGFSSISLHSEDTLHFSLDFWPIQEGSITEEEEDNERKALSGIREQPVNNNMRKQVRFESIFIREFDEKDCVGTLVTTTSSSHPERNSIYRREVCFPIDQYEKLFCRNPVVIVSKSDKRPRGSKREPKIDRKK